MQEDALQHVAGAANVAIVEQHRRRKEMGKRLYKRLLDSFAEQQEWLASRGYDGWMMNGDDVEFISLKAETLQRYLMSHLSREEAHDAIRRRRRH